MKHPYIDESGQLRNPNYDMLDSIEEEKSENERLENAQEITKEEFEKILGSAAPFVLCPECETQFECLRIQKCKLQPEK